MSLPCRAGLPAVLLLALIAVGCEPEAATNEPSEQSANTAPPGDASTTDASVSEADAPKGVALETVTPDKLNELVAGHKGKVVLVDFWATWCIPCLQQYPHTVELSEKHADDLVVYSVSMDETDEETLNLVKEKLGEWPAGKVRTLKGATGADLDAFTAFEITEGALPHYKVFGRDGQLVATLGGTEEVPTSAKVDAAVEAALAK